MRLPRDQIVISAPPGTLRRWLKSDMRILRWVFLALYLTIVATCLFALLRRADVFIIVFAVVMVVSQVLFIFGAGTMRLCHPVHRRRLVLPVAAGGLMLAVL